MSDDMVVRLLDAQRRRLVATIMGHAERAFFSKLTQPERDEFRAKVLDGVAAFSDFTRDVVKIADTDFVRNERVLELIESIHSGQRDLIRRIEDTHGE